LASSMEASPGDLFGTPQVGIGGRRDKFVDAAKASNATENIF
jgi:hypothetical protein